MITPQIDLSKIFKLRGSDGSDVFMKNLGYEKYPSKWFKEQKLDHFDSENNCIWEQVSDTFNLLHPCFQNQVKLNDCFQ